MLRFWHTQPPIYHTNTIPSSDLHTRLLTLLAVLRLLVTLKCVVGDVVQTEDPLHWVFYDQILAILKKSDCKIKPCIAVTMISTFCCIMMSRMHLTTPQALSMFRLIC